MADVIITLKLMGENPDVDMDSLEQSALKILFKFAYDYEGDISAEKEKQGVKTSVEDVAFGLKALQIIYAMDESKGDTTPLEKQLADLDGVRSCEVVGITRAMG